MPAANWPSWYGGHRTKQASGASQDGFIRWMAAARSRSSHVRRQDTHRQPIQARRRPERWSPRLSWPIRILHRPERQCPLYGFPVHRFCVHSPWHAPLSPRLLQRFRLPEVTAYPSIGSLPDIANLRTADFGLRNRCRRMSYISASAAGLRRRRPVAQSGAVGQHHARLTRGSS